MYLCVAWCCRVGLTSGAVAGGRQAGPTHTHTRTHTHTHTVINNFPSPPRLLSPHPLLPLITPPSSPLYGKITYINAMYAVIRHIATLAASPLHPPPG